VSAVVSTRESASADTSENTGADGRRALQTRLLERCQAPDLSNPTSLFDRRIDFIVARGPFKVLGTQLVGEQAADRTATGRWPSDHAGVVTRFRLPPP
jgi:hypothetical protein